MPTVYERALEQRAALLARDQEVAARLIDAYKVSEKSLQARLKGVTDLIQAKRDNGEEPTANWLFQQARYQKLLDQVEAEISRFATYTGEQTVQAQREAAESGITDAHELIRVGSEEAGVTASFAKLPKSATEALVSSLQPDAPLAKLLAEFGKDAAEKAKNALVVGVSTGQGIPVIAANFRAATNASLSRATLIARTETLRSYRTASLMQYQEAASLLDGWIWTSTLEEHTCTACLALHNTVHPVDEPFASHPACRCCPRPLVAGSKPRGISGEEWLSQQSEKTQQRILGKSAAEAFKKGEVKLADFIAYSENHVYGASVRVASLEAAKAARKGEVALTRRLPMPAQHDTAERVRSKILDADRLYGERIKPLEDRVARLSDVADAAQTDKQREGAYLNLATAQARLDQMQTDRRERMQLLLTAPNPTEIKTDMGGGIGQRSDAMIQVETAQFARYVSEDVLAKGKTARFISLRDGGVVGNRSRYDPDDGTIEVERNLSPDDDRGGIVHEMGHWLEAQSPDVLRAAQEFYDRRTAGEPLVSLIEATGDNDYHPNEMTRVDHFLNAYMGKDFPNRDGTEIVTMGAEMLYNEPERLARDDADYFAFLLKTLQGRG